MSTDTHVPAGSTGDAELNAKIRFRGDKFNVLTAILGCTNEGTRAALVNVDPKTLSRVRAGDTAPGSKFIAHTLAGLERHADTLARYNVAVRFEELFEIDDQPEQAAA